MFSRCFNFKTLHFNTLKVIVTRLKDNAKIEFFGQHREAKQKLGVIHDDMIVFESDISFQKYPDILRRIVFYDDETEKPYVFITNNLKLAASSIAAIYKQRW